ncbi:hypothetical protein QJS10_CPA07g00148 [Acorus calamus]|uniref:Uncharacterized protein n=1 Tax=Acorus calamus TaxID=4465 RepID=A0AAV9EGY2_ACOCL|nr:hypothetical protein QJS10_CPA07g00148 [Acorus calamus]
MGRSSNYMLSRKKARISTKQIMILILLWNIWAARNEVVFSKRQSSASIVAARAIAHTKECCSQLARIEDKGVIRSRHNDIGFGVQNMNRVITQNRTYIITDGGVSINTRAAGAAFIITRANPRQILGAGLSGWPWASRCA